MIKVYIYDSDIRRTERIKNILRKVAQESESDIYLKRFDMSVDMFCEFEHDKHVVDIICIDVDLEESGLGIGKKLRELGFEGEIVFFAKEKRGAVEIFETKPLCFVWEDERSYLQFQNILKETFRQFILQPKNCLISEKNKVIRRIPIQSVLYITVKGRSSEIHCTDAVYTVFLTIKKLEDKLKAKNFVRIHRNHLVNRSYATKKGERSVEVLGGEILGIGSTYLKSVEREVCTSLWESA
jgi:Response regulator of the LytR/AlgR family